MAALARTFRTLQSRPIPRGMGCAGCALRGPACRTCPGMSSFYKRGAFVLPRGLGQVANPSDLIPGQTMGSYLTGDAIWNALTGHLTSAQELALAQQNAADLAKASGAATPTPAQMAQAVSDAQAGLASAAPLSITDLIPNLSILNPLTPSGDISVGALLIYAALAAGGYFLYKEFWDR